MAGRIPQHFIDDLLARVNIIDVLDGRVSKLKRTGKNYAGLCPFHKEKTPSFTANPEKQFYYCFGCGAGGNALSFLMEYERLDFPDAIEELAKMVGMEVPRETASPQQQQRDQQLKDIYTLLEDASQYYCDQLRQHPARGAAVNYLKQRGLSGQIAKQFRIGLAPPGWDNLLSQLGGDDKQRALLEKAGLLIRNEERGSLYDRFRERIMFPIRDQRGRVIAFGGRVLGDAKPKYLNSPETDTFHKSRELYGLYEARQHNAKLERLIIVEGYMDVIGLAQYGITYAVATLGTATTAQHLERLFKMVREVVFCFDGDEAGRNAARRALETTLPVISDGKEARFLFLPEGEDPDSLVRKEGPEAFQQRLNGALPLSSFFFQTLQRDIDLDHLDGRARFSREALPLIGAMQPSILRQMMLNQVQQLTGLSEQQLEELQQHGQATTPSAAVSRPAAEQAPPPPDYAYPAPEADFPAEPAPLAGPAEYYADHSPAPAQPRWQKRNDWQRRGSWPSRERQQPKQPPPRTTQLSHKLSTHVLHFPALASLVDNPERYKQLDEAGIELFCSLCAYLQQHPQANLGMLLVDWSSDPALFHWVDTVNAITQSEPVETEQSAENSLRDGLAKLDKRLIDQRLKELRNKQPLTRDEKAELTALLMRKARPVQA